MSLACFFALFILACTWWPAYVRIGLKCLAVTDLLALEIIVYSVFQRTVDSTILTNSRNVYVYWTRHGYAAASRFGYDQVHIIAPVLLDTVMWTLRLPATWVASLFTVLSMSSCTSGVE